MSENTAPDAPGALGEHGAPDEHGAPGEGEERRLCPVCLAPLTRERFRGEWIDGCEEHGLWLDNGEIERILARRRHSLTEARKRALSQARRDGKFSGILFGWLSLFWD